MFIWLIVPSGGAYLKKWQKKKDRQGCRSKGELPKRGQSQRQLVAYQGLHPAHK